MRTLISEPSGHGWAASARWAAAAAAIADEADENATNSASPSEPKMRPPFALDRVADQPPVLLQQVRVGVAERLDEAGRALDVGEQERRRLCRRPISGRDQNSSMYERLVLASDPQELEPGEVSLAPGVARAIWRRRLRARRRLADSSLKNDRYSAAVRSYRSSNAVSSAVAFCGVLPLGQTFH